MLVLGRNNQEIIVINSGTKDEIRITLVDSWRGRARIGFVAPPHIIIQRSELLERDSIVQAEKQDKPLL